MDDKLARTVIRSAKLQVRKLKKPVGVRADQWRGIIALLTAIAEYLPDPYPSQRVLAAKLDVPVGTVQRHVRKAVALGLLATLERPNPGGHRPGTTYRLLYLSPDLKSFLVTRPQIERKDKSSSSKKTVTSPALRAGSSRPAAGRLSKDAPDMPMNRFDPGADDPDLPIGADKVAPLPARGVKPPDAAVALARRFDDEWWALVRRDPSLSDIRGSSRGHAIGYLRKIMLEEISEEHALAYMDLFFDAVGTGRLELKPGQFAFERFAHWWGREPVADPALDKKRKAHVADVLDRYRRMTDEDDHLTDR